jgi:hypothetical protein
VVVVSDTEEPVDAAYTIGDAPWHPTVPSWEMEEIALAAGHVPVTRLCTLVGSIVGFG